MFPFTCLQLGWMTLKTAGDGDGLGSWPQVCLRRAPCVSRSFGGQQATPSVLFSWQWEQPKSSLNARAHFQLLVCHKPKEITGSGPDSKGGQVYTFHPEATSWVYRFVILVYEAKNYGR